MSKLVVDNFCTCCLNFERSFRVSVLKCLMFTYIHTLFIPFILSVCLSVCPCLPVFLCLSVLVYLYLSVCLSVCLPLSTCLYGLSVCLYVCLSLSTCLCLSVCQSGSQPVIFRAGEKLISVGLAYLDFGKSNNNGKLITCSC